MSWTRSYGAAVELHEYHSTIPVAFVVLAWIWVAVPFAYGVWQLLIKLGPIFGG